MVRMMQDLTGVDPHTIPLDDPDTMSIFTSSKVLGYENDEILGPTGAVAIPEFNTRFTRQMLCLLYTSASPPTAKTWAYST